MKVRCPLAINGECDGKDLNGDPDQRCHHYYEHENWHKSCLADTVMCPACIVPNNISFYLTTDDMEIK
jgi:hypothetical protein